MNELFNPIITATAKSGAWLLDWSWQAAVLLACVWIGLKIFRVKSPALRHQVWLFALIAVIAMPVLSGVVRGLPLPKPKSNALGYAVELPRIVITNGAVPVIQTTSQAVTAGPSTSKPIILSLSFILWIAGALVFAAKTAINFFKVRRLRDGSRRVSLADLGCNDCECEALRSGNALLALSDEIRSPMLIGLLRPMIVFPADIAVWTSQAERRAMLRHELAHVARRDHFVNLFQSVLGVVFFFHPLVRYTCRQLRLEREIACDDYVVGSGVEAETYAESIIKVAERSVALVGAPGGVHQLALFSTRQILERRIEMILNQDRIRALAHQRRYMFLFAAVIAMISVLMISGRNGNIAAQPAIVDSDEQILIAMVRQVAEGIPRQINFGGPSASPYLRFKDFAGDPGEDMWPKFDGFIRQNLTVTRVAVDDFHVRIEGSAATVGFLGVIYLKDPAGGQENKVADRYTVEMVKANGQWRAVKLPPPPPPPPRPEGPAQPGDSAPPPPPPPPQARSDEQTLLAIIQEAANSNIAHDTSVFERLLADDYIGTGPDGSVQNKAQSVAEVKRQDIAYTKIDIDDFRARIDGNSAVTNFLGTIFFKAQSEESSVQYRYTISFVKRDGRWLILAIHMSGKL